MTRDEIVRLVNGIENVTNDTKFHKQLSLVFVEDRNLLGYGLLTHVREINIQTVPLSLSSCEVVLEREGRCNYQWCAHLLHTIPKLYVILHAYILQ